MVAGDVLKENDGFEAPKPPVAPNVGADAPKRPPPAAGAVVPKGDAATVEAPKMDEVAAGWLAPANNEPPAAALELKLKTLLVGATRNRYKREVQGQAHQNTSKLEIINLLRTDFQHTCRGACAKCAGSER